MMRVFSPYLFAGVIAVFQPGIIFSTRSHFNLADLFLPESNTLNDSDRQNLQADPEAHQSQTSQ